MLFNSYIFIFIFLPLVVGIFHFLRYKAIPRLAICFLILASFVFYAWWNPKYLFLLIPLLASDYCIARSMIRSGVGGRASKLLMLLGVAINLGALCYFKYANFLVDNINHVFENPFSLAPIVLPIGISFFTFQKIAFLCDLHEGKIKSFNLIDYCLFVTFFPQLIAGPIVHHSEMMPQFSKLKPVTRQQLDMGLTMFIFGLAKKVIVADNAAYFVSPVFNAVSAGGVIDTLTAWTAVLCYTIQLYFDFSAYSDMAIGIGLLFGIHLPLNFNSPYKAVNIIDFWRRWHMTLSRFLRDYVYIRLGGNRKGKIRRYINLMLTMIIGGVWHGAGWTYFIWGALHGFYLIVNHGWHAVKRSIGLDKMKEPFLVLLFYRLVIFLAVVIGWVFFRSANLEVALVFITRMFTFYDGPALDIINTASGLTVAGLAFLVVFFMPNTQEIVLYVGPESDSQTYTVKPSRRFLQWQPNLKWATFMSLMFAVCIMLFSQISEFIYFQF